MKKILTVVAVAVAVAFAGPAFAKECPLLIKQLKEAKVDPAKKAQVDKLVAEAQKLHDTGKHEESVKKADEAAKVAGITLKHKE